MIYVFLAWLTDPAFKKKFHGVVTIVASSLVLFFNSLFSTTTKKTTLATFLAFSVKLAKNVNNVLKVGFLSEYFFN